MEELKKAFDDYITVLEKEFIDRPKEDISDGMLRLIKSVTIDSIELNSIVSRVEENPAFQRLIEATAISFSEYKNHHFYIYSGIVKILKKPVPVYNNQLFWFTIISNFFRRSECYFRLYDREKINRNQFFKDYCDALKKNNVEFVYLVPLEGVQFDVSIIDFGDFKIQRFTENELNIILQNHIGGVFYYWAFADTRSLKKYWFIYVKESIPLAEVGSLHSDMRDDLLKQRFAGYSQKVQSALQVLSIYNWGKPHLYGDPVDLDIIMGRITDEEAKKKRVEIKKTQIEGLKMPFEKFNIPFILSVHDNLLDFPQKAPPLSTPQINDQIVKIDSLVDKVSTTKENYSPTLHFDKSETKIFIKTIKQIKNVADNVYNEGSCDYLCIAFDYLAKAFFSEGLDQLLWHIAVLEALLGEKGEIRNTISRRTATILGDTEARREFLRKQVNDLYDFRSDLVHGNKFKKEVEFEHLWIARNLARKTLLWFLNYLSHLKKEGHKIPDREEILLLLDLKERKKLSIKSLLDNLPQGFPNIKEWTD